MYASSASGGAIYIVNAVRRTPARRRPASATATNSASAAAATVTTAVTAATTAPARPPSAPANPGRRPSSSSVLSVPSLRHHAQPAFTARLPRPQKTSSSPLFPPAEK